MSKSRADRIAIINAQRSTISEHVDKYNKFKSDGDYTSSATKTIKNSQRIIGDNNDGIDPSWEDTWQPD